MGNPQDLATKDVFVKHPQTYTDSFLLFLKATMLFGRVTDYNTRTNLRAPPSKASDPFSNPAFAALDQLVCESFLSSLPPEYRHLGLGESGTLDTDIYMVHVVPHAYGFNFLIVSRSSNVFVTSVQGHHHAA